MTATISNPEPYTIFNQPGQEWIGYDPMDCYYTESDLPELIASYGEDDSRVKAVREQGAYFDNDEDTWEIEDLHYDLTEWMEQTIAATPGAIHGWWVGEGRNHGWRHQSGYMEPFQAKDGGDLLYKVLPNTECTYKIHRCQDSAEHPGIAITNAHHDAPMGGEMFYLFPLREESEEGIDDAS